MKALLVLVLCCFAATASAQGFRPRGKTVSFKSPGGAKATPAAPVTSTAPVVNPADRTVANSTPQPVASSPLKKSKPVAKKAKKAGGKKARKSKGGDGDDVVVVDDEEDDEEVQVIDE